MNFHHWGISKNISKCQVKLSTENLGTTAKTGSQIWSEASAYTLPYELYDGSLIDSPGTIPTGYVIIDAILDSSTGEKLNQDLLLYGGAWGFEAENPIYVITYTGTPSIINPENMIAVSDFCSYVQLESNVRYIAIGSGTLKRTSEILSPKLIDLGSNYLISSTQQISLSYTDKFALSGKCYRLKTSAPAVNVNFQYKISTNIASDIFKAVKNAIRYDDSYEILLDKADPLSSEDLLLIAGTGPDIKQESRGTFDLTISGRVQT